MSSNPVSWNKAEAKHRSLAANVSMSKATMNLRSNDNASKRVSVVDSVDKAITEQGWEPAALYVFGDKSNLKVRFFPEALLKLGLNIF